MLPFLLLLLATASAERLDNLIENWECGSNGWTKEAAYQVTQGCDKAVQRGANLCCMQHDMCYEMRKAHGNTQEFCDHRFCHCLQDVNDIAKIEKCSWKLGNFCSLVITVGAKAYQNSAPVEHHKRYVDFVDHEPFKLSMKTLLDACYYSDDIVIHCHNSVVKCLSGEHEIERRETDPLALATRSSEDCHSTAYDCLQMVIESEKNEGCIAVARDFSKKASGTYAQLDADKHGDAIIAAYPVVAARLLKQCPKYNGIERCFHCFNYCAILNMRDKPEIFNAAMRIKSECHRELRECLEKAMPIKEVEKDTEVCMEARHLALTRIRMNKLKKPLGFFEKLNPLRLFFSQEENFNNMGRRSECPKQEDTPEAPKIDSPTKIASRGTRPNSGFRIAGSFISIMSLVRLL